MKFRFDPRLDFQLQAVESVCDLFKGQEQSSTEFTITQPFSGDASSLGEAFDGLGIGNHLTLDGNQLLANLQEIQERNGLSQSTSLDSRNFTIEMETGTGKTYVYLRTIFELNRRFGFSKFVIVVPSIAIKEGVYKTLQITDEHFRWLYSGESFDYFLYDSARIGQVRNFASDSQIQIMIVTVGAINKQNVNNLYKSIEDIGGLKPIDLIRSTCPIVIVDEPQSVDGGVNGNGRKALDQMSPLCMLRYSATHVDKHHMLFRLHAVDAYQKKLVKQIEVASATIENAHNKPYVRLLSVNNKRGSISAKVELDCDVEGDVRRTQMSVQDGDDLELVSGRSVYSDCRIGEIRATKGDEFLELRVPNTERFLLPGQAWGDVDLNSLHREMIRRTIREHLDKEKRLRKKRIKVLSLFFVDAVNHYRNLDDQGNAIKGKFAVIFEEEFKRLARNPIYRELYSEEKLDSLASTIHGGYFSIDKQNAWTDTYENNQTNRESAERAYNLIMREKEKLLSFEEPLKFIFSHSALREGWDNPNVFQICTLRNIRTERERRQTIGRGLRLCVNQDGDRVDDDEVNKLTVIAAESFREFAENLQREIEEDTGIRFGVIQPNQFAKIVIHSDDSESTLLGLEQSQEIFEHLRDSNYISEDGEILDSLRDAIRQDTLSIPQQFQFVYEEILTSIRQATTGLEIKDSNERQLIQLRDSIYHSVEFKELWNRIKFKTTYRVKFDNRDLLQKCSNALRSAPSLPKTHFQWRTADIAIRSTGVEATETEGSSTVTLVEANIELPDILTELQNRTQLTRRSLCQILIESGRLEDFKLNPQRFIELTTQTINRIKQQVLVDGIKYQKARSDSYYAQELFEEEEVSGYLSNMLDAKKAVFTQVVYDSDVEAKFADQLEKSRDVRVYAKLPRWFRVPTPLGSYNPDWALLVNSELGARLYFVVETKGSTTLPDLRALEAAKIACGEKHFEALREHENPANFRVATCLEDVLATL